MKNDNRQVIYCEDGEYRLYCYICDNLSMERYFKNHLKSQTYTKNIRKRQQLNKSFHIISQY